MNSRTATGLLGIGELTCHGKNLLGACGKREGDGQGAEYNEQSFHGVPVGAESGILPSQQHVQRVPAGHLHTQLCISDLPDQIDTFTMLVSALCPCSEVHTTTFCKSADMVAGMCEQWHLHAVTTNDAHELSCVQLSHKIYGKEMAYNSTKSQ